MSSSTILRPSRAVRTEYPYLVEKFTSITVLLKDGIQLAANLWIPQNVDESVRKEEKFATILEYLPYRKADWTSTRDEIRLKYFAGFGYASMRVDIRGTGNSQGIFDDEYSYQEQSDALEILQWIQDQTWSNGKVIIYGKSWGGFNGLQIGFLQPKNLVGIISAYSTDDRYSDDVHYWGGCLAAQNALSWSSQMLIWLAIPPHPSHHGGIEENSDLQQLWRERLDHLLPLDYYWLKHQTRFEQRGNDYWRYGSICEDYSKIECPVLLIGGFADLYSDPVFRLMSKLTCPKRAILGPWGHQWPDDGFPGPQIGFLQEVVAWLDYHVKGIANDYDKKELLSVYQLEPNVEELHPVLEERRGKWIHFNDLPKYPVEHGQRNHLNVSNAEITRPEGDEIVYYLSVGSLHTEPIPETSSPTNLSFLSPQETGMASGQFFESGFLHNPNHSIDQRLDDGHSLCFDSAPLADRCELFGFPSVTLNLSSDCPNGLICVRLCMIDANTSASILLANGILNLTHHQSHDHPEELTIDRIYRINVTLSGVCVALPTGCRLRLGLSSSYWPLVWPASQLATLTLHLDPLSPCLLQLPRLTAHYSARNDFAVPEIAEGIPIKCLRECSSRRIRTLDEVKETIILQINEDDGSIEYADGLLFDERMQSVYTIKRNDPQSARIEIDRNLQYHFPDHSAFKVHIQTKSILFTEPSPSTFHVTHQLHIQNKNEQFFNKTWNFAFPRMSN